MKCAILVTSLGFVGSLLAADPKKEPAKPKSPFLSVVTAGDALIAKLPPDSRRRVWLGNEMPRESERGQAFSVRAGQVLHTGPDKAGWMYQFKPQFHPSPGFNVTATYDTTTQGLGWPRVGGGIKRMEEFFISAK